MSTQPDKGTVQETVVTTPETSPMTYDNRKGRRKRRMRVLMGVLGLLFILKLGGVGWLTSPYGATALTTLVLRVGNAALEPVGWRLGLKGVGDLWKGEIRLWDLSLSDAGGEWLRMPEAVLHPGRVDVLPGPDGVRNVSIARVLLVQPLFSRLPETLPASSAGPSLPGPLQLLPEGVRVTVDSLEVISAGVDVGDQPLFLSARAAGFVATRQAQLRVALHGYPSAGGALPHPPQDLPDDVNQSLSAGHNAPAGADIGNTPHTGQAVLTLDWADGYADLRIMGRDSLLLHRALPGLERVWSRSRVQAYVPQWPLDAAHPMHVRWACRFGLRGAALGEQVRPSLLSGQAQWDGQRLVVQDVDMSVPVSEPWLRVQGSMGMDREQGPGMQIDVRLEDVRALVRTLGLQETASMGGSLALDVDVSRGGRHAGWWQTPLPEPPPFAQHPLPGFAVAMPPADTTTPVSLDTPRVAGARASQSPTALHIHLRALSPQLEWSEGRLGQVDVLLQGSSVEAATAPEGTGSRRTSAATTGTKTVNTAVGGAPPATVTRMEETVKETVSVTASKTPQDVDADAGDFTALGLPRALVGSAQVGVGSFFGLGDASLSTSWMAAGMHSEADIFQAQFDALAVRLPGVRLSGDVGLAYALPLRRLWPWLDGELALTVEHGKALAHLGASPLHLQGVGLRLRLESLFDAQGSARQYLKADVNADQVQVPAFTVRQVRGQGVSQHVHALTDTVLLAMTPPGWLQEAGEGKASREMPPPDMALLDARVSVGAGTGGPVKWDSGQCAVRVAGEEALFDARLTGVLEALLAGTYNFRDRLLRLRMNGSPTPVPPASPASPPASPRVTPGQSERPGGLLPFPSLTLHVEGQVKKTGAGNVLALQVVSEGDETWGHLTATARLPLRLGPVLQWDTQAPLAAHAAWQGSLEGLWRHVPLPGRQLTGQAAATLDVAGTLLRPLWTLKGQVDKAAYVDRVDGFLLQDIGLTLDSADAGESRLVCRATDGRGGSLALNGNVRQGPQGWMVSGTGQVAHFRPLRRDDLTVQLSGTLGLEGPLAAPGPVLRGEIRLDEGAFELHKGFSVGVRSLEDVEEGLCVSCPPLVTPATAAKAPSAPSGDAPRVALPQLDVRIHAPGRFFIRGRGLDSEWKADLDVKGTADQLRLTGSLEPVRGALELLGRQFRFSRGSISFDGGIPPNPALDLTLAFQNPQITALVRVLGTGRRPAFDLTSQPVLPRDEVMAQVLFGKSMGNLSRFETLQAANAALQLLELGPAGLDVLGTARDKLGLQVLRLGSGGGGKRVDDTPRTLPGNAPAPGGVGDDSEETVLEAGKYLTDTVYVGVEQGMRPQEGTAVRVEVELMPNLSLSGRTSPQGSGVGLDWKRDY